MKKSILTLVLAVSTAIVIAQPDMMTKRGESILPETGDWALGTDAWPFFQYAGNLFNNTSDNQGPWFSSPVWQEGIVIFGKYVKDPSTHYRAGVRIGFGSEKIELQTLIDPDDTIPSTPPQMGTDEYKTSGNGITLIGGIEKRKGKGRVQGYYGGEVCIGFGSTKETFNYANAITMTTQNPAISSDWGNFGTPSYPYNSYGRISEIKHGSNFMFGIDGFIGVEYFFMAHASLGAEFHWGLMMRSMGARETTASRWGDPSFGEADALITTTTESPGKQSSFGIDTDVDGWDSNSKYGSVRLLFYFGGGGTTTR